MSGSFPGHRASAPDLPAALQPDSDGVNRDFYDRLWSQSRLILPERFNTWPLISALLPRAPQRLEIGPGLRPRLPIPGTCFIDICPVAIKRLRSAGGLALPHDSGDLPFENGTFELVAAFDVIEHI